MRYMVIGPGALGCLVSSYINRGRSQEDSLYLLDHNQERVQHLNQHGIQYEWDGTTTNFSIQAHHSPTDIGVVDVLLICVKSYDVEKTLSLCKPLLQPGTLLLFLQNGIAHLKFSRQLGIDCGYVSSTEGATRLGPGHIRHAGKGLTYMGFLDPAPPSVTALMQKTSECLSLGGMEVHIDLDIKTRLWAKLFVNVAINAFTAIHHCKNGRLLSLPGVTEKMKVAIDEAMEVARSLGITIAADPYKLALSVCQSTANNVSSMLQDVQAKRSTEIDAINGAVVKEAEILGIDTPINRELFEKIKQIESEYI